MVLIEVTRNKDFKKMRESFIIQMSGRRTYHMEERASISSQNCSMPGILGNNKEDSEVPQREVRQRRGEKSWIILDPLNTLRTWLLLWGKNREPLKVEGFFICIMVLLFSQDRVQEYDGLLGQSVCLKIYQILLDLF